MFSNYFYYICIWKYCVMNKTDKLPVKKTSVQISENVHGELKRLCEEQGYKLSGYLDKILKSAITGSKKQQLNG